MTKLIPKCQEGTKIIPYEKEMSMTYLGNNGKPLPTVNVVDEKPDKEYNDYTQAHADERAAFLQRVADRPDYEGLRIGMTAAAMAPSAFITAANMAGFGLGDKIFNSSLFGKATEVAPRVFNSMMPSGAIQTAANGLTQTVVKLPTWATTLGKVGDAAMLSGFATKGISDLTNKENWKPNSTYTSGVNSIPNYLTTALEVAPAAPVVKDVAINLRNPQNYKRAYNNISLPFRNYYDLYSGKLENKIDKRWNLHYDRFAENYDKGYDAKKLLEKLKQFFTSAYEQRFAFNKARILNSSEVPYGINDNIDIPIDLIHPLIKESNIARIQHNDPISFITHDGKTINGLQTNIDVGLPVATRATWFPGHTIINYHISGLPFPIKSFNNPEYNKALLKELEYMESTGAIPVGSSRLIAKGYFGGNPGDMEILTTKQLALKLADMLKFVKTKDTTGGTGWGGYSPITMVGSEGSRANLDINILKDNGTLIHQFEATRRPTLMPRLYSELARLQSVVVPFKPGLSADLRIPKPEGGFYSNEEYFQLLKDNPDLVDLHLIDNLFKSNKPKHVDRARMMLFNPNHSEKVSTAIQHIYDQVEGSEKLTQRFPNINWNDIELNKQFLKNIGLPQEMFDEVASNPEIMKNLADYWYMRNTIGSRSVNFDPSRSSLNVDQVLGATRSFDNGSSAGGGGNFVLGSKFGGFTRNFTGYSQYHLTPNKLNPNLSDIFAERDRLNIVFVTPEFNLVIKEANEKFGIELSSNTYDRFTDEITKLVNQGKLTPEQADDYINYVSHKLNITGFRGQQYSNLGTYFGGMRKASETPHSIRTIDSLLHNLPILPAEFGSNNIYYNNHYDETHSFVDIKNCPSDVLLDLLKKLIKCWTDISKEKNLYGNKTLGHFSTKEKDLSGNPVIKYFIDLKDLLEPTSEEMYIDKTLGQYSYDPSIYIDGKYYKPKSKDEIKIIGEKEIKNVNDVIKNSQQKEDESRNMVNQISDKIQLIRLKRKHPLMSFNKLKLKYMSNSDDIDIVL